MRYIKSVILKLVLQNLKIIIIIFKNFNINYISQFKNTRTQNKCYQNLKKWVDNRIY